MFKRNYWIKRYILFVLFLFLASSVHGGTIVGSRHDLSTGTTPEICEFCHTPHSANPKVDGPLWNRFVDASLVFTLYSSSTMDTTPSPPSPVSRLCLGCHDGVLGTSVAHDQYLPGSTKHDLVNPPHGDMPDMTSYPNCERCHPGFYSGRPPTLNLGTDLSNDHPISMSYPTAEQDPEYNTPPDLQN